MISERGRRLSAAGEVAGGRREAGANGTSSKLGYSLAESRPDFMTGHPSLFNWSAAARALTMLSVILRERLPGIANEMDGEFGEKLQSLLFSFRPLFPTL